MGEYAPGYEPLMGFDEIAKENGTTAEGVLGRARAGERVELCTKSKCIVCGRGISTFVTFKRGKFQMARHHVCNPAVLARIEAGRKSVDHCAEDDNENRQLPEALRLYDGLRSMEME